MKGEEREKREKCFYVSNVSWVPGGSRVLSGGYCTEGELKKKRADGAEKKRERESELLYLKISFLFPPFTLCLLNEFCGRLCGKCISFFVMVQFLP